MEERGSSGASHAAHVLRSPSLHPISRQTFVNGLSLTKAQGGVVSELGLDPSDIVSALRNEINDGVTAPPIVVGKRCAYLLTYWRLAEKP